MAARMIKKEKQQYWQLYKEYKMMDKNLDEYINKKNKEKERKNKRTWGHLNRIWKCNETKSRTWKLQ